MKRVLLFLFVILAMVVAGYLLGKASAPQPKGPEAKPVTAERAKDDADPAPADVDAPTTLEAARAVGAGHDAQLAVPPAGRKAALDRDVEMGSRQAAEMDALICRETGETCPPAKGGGEKER